jgi:hypothetical protein
VNIDTILTLQGTFDNKVPDLSMICEIDYMNPAIRYTLQGADPCPGMLRRWGIHLVE